MQNNGSQLLTQSKSQHLEATRDYQMDNIRSILIYLVVFGHLLETIKGNDVTSDIYKCIYLFHMPAMLFLSGFFARYRPAALIRKILFPYLLFQLMYLSFSCYVTHSRATLDLQFTTPYWLLWYLLALFVYGLILPFFQTGNWRTASRLLIVCVILSLIAGFDNTIGYYLSLSRILVFLPFYVAGHYCASFSLRAMIDRHKRLIIVWAVIMIIVLETLLIMLEVPAEALYGSYSYDALDSNILIRFLFLLCASLWILFLLAVIPHQKLPIMTSIGQRTFPIFLLHGFIQRIIISIRFLRGDPYLNLLLAAVLSAVITAILAIKPLNRLFTKLFSQSRKHSTS